MLSFESNFSCSKLHIQSITCLLLSLAISIACYSIACTHGTTSVHSIVPYEMRRAFYEREIRDTGSAY